MNKNHYKQSCAPKHGITERVPVMDICLERFPMFLVKKDFEVSVSDVDLGSTLDATHLFCAWFQFCTSSCSRFAIVKFVQINNPLRRC